MSLERRQLEAAMAAAADRERKLTFRPVLASARGGFDPRLLRVRRMSLRIERPGNGATAADVGSLWSVPGYSRPGGPDVVPLGSIVE